MGRRAATALVLALAACASAAGPARLAGTVAYRERITLTPDSRVVVTLLDVSLVDAPARVIAEREIVTSGEQVPIPFVLEFERAELQRGHRYGVRATIAAPDGRLAFSTTTAQPVLGPGDPEAPALLLQRVAAGATPAGPRVLAYACDGFAFRVEVTRERATLFLPERSVTLPAVPAASGAKYSDGDTTYWSRGDEASLTLDDAEHAGCRAQPLRAP